MDFLVKELNREVNTIGSKSNVVALNVQPILTGHDLEEFGLDAGPNFRTILDDLLYARLDERVTTEEEERDLVQRKYL